MTSLAGLRDRRKVSSGSSSAAQRIDRALDEAEAARARGNWREAARAFLDAAARIDPSEPPPKWEVRGEQALALELRAADCYIRGGALGQGWGLLRAALERYEVQVPSSATKALLGTTWRRGRYMVRDSTLDNPARSRNEGERLRMMALHAAARSLGLIHTALADALRTHLLTEVGRFGDASERCRALAGEVSMQTRIGNPFDKSVKKLLARCESLAQQTQEPFDAAHHQLALATCEFSHGRWRNCVEYCEQAEALLARAADYGEEVSHERARVTALHWFALAWLGELSELRERLDREILGAERRKDSLVLLEALTGQPVLVWLAADELEIVRDRAAELLATHRGVVGAAWPESGYRRQQYRDLMAEVHACLYRGDPLPAWAALCEQWRELESAFYLPLRTIGMELRCARARTGVAVLESFERDPLGTRRRLDALCGAGSWTRARVAADARERIEALRRDPNCASSPLASLLAAGLAKLEGQREEALALLDLAVRELSSVEMALHRECARHALGELIGGREGSQLQDQAETWMRRHKVLRPRKLVASQAPGFGVT